MMDNSVRPKSNNTPYEKRICPYSQFILSICRNKKVIFPKTNIADILAELKKGIYL